MTEERKVVETTESQIKLAQLIKEGDMKTVIHSDPMKMIWFLEEFVYAHGIDLVLDKVLDNIVPKESLKWYERVMFWFGRKGLSFVLANHFSKYWNDMVDDMTEMFDKLDEWAEETLKGNKNDMKGLS